MIEARIVLRCGSYEQHHERIIWCIVHIGECAIARDSVGKSTPWFMEFTLRESIWHFSNEADASMFALRWAVTIDRPNRNLLSVVEQWFNDTEIQGAVMPGRAYFKTYSDAIAFILRWSF